MFHLQSPVLRIETELSSKVITLYARGHSTLRCAALGTLRYLIQLIQLKTMLFTITLQNQSNPCGIHHTLALSASLNSLDAPGPGDRLTSSLVLFLFVTRQGRVICLVALAIFSLLVLCFLL